MIDPDNNNFEIADDNEYRKWSSRFCEYLLLDQEYRICVAGETVEELLLYPNGFLKGKTINILSENDQLKASLILQTSKNFFEWTGYRLKAKDGRTVEVEICGLKNDRIPAETIIIRMRSSRNNFPITSSVAAKKIVRWIFHNLKTPLRKIQVLIDLALMDKNEEELGAYLRSIAVQAQQVDTKLKRMIRFANKLFK